MENPTSSTPGFQEFFPHIPMQRRVLRDISAYDYSLGVHEIMLSGSVGCLREDALIQTASGAIPICDIDGSSRVLSYHGGYDQFCFSLSSGAFPKGKDYLYRVIGEHGEFVASGHHLLATSPYTYSKVSDLDLSSGPLLVPHVRLNEHHEAFRLVLRANVLHCSEILLSLLGNCAKHIRQCDLQLLSDLSSVLELFPSQAGALEYGLFFCKNRSVLVDDLPARVLEPFHTSELSGQSAMMRLLHLLGSKSAGGEGVCIQDDSKFSLRKLRELLTLSLFEMHTAHPQAVRSFLASLLASLLELLAVDVGHTNSTIYAVERLDKQEWYWDLQVPNTHNYVSNGYQHHNSAKSILMAHIILRHCFENKRARFLIGRRALPDIKATIFTKIIEHLEGLPKSLYYVHKSTAYIRFANGSEIISKSWADKHYHKMRSLELSGACIEELTENEGDDEQAYHEIKMRVGRLPHIKTPLMICATNPGGPSHWAYKYFIADTECKTKHVYYSLTHENPFLPKSYVDNLKSTLDPKLARRMLHGEWIEIAGEHVYYMYDKDIHFKKEKYRIRPNVPIWLSWDFNIGEGKPMSACAAQYINGHFHFFAEVIIDGARTADTVDEFLERDIIRPGRTYFVTGDASGRSKDTRSLVSDYDIIEKKLANAGIKYEMRVPRLNPPIRTRHNRVNAYLKNLNEDVRVTVWDCPTIDDGLRLVKLKKGSSYLEDDSLRSQHVTTAVGYCIMRATAEDNRPVSTYQQL